MFNIRRDAFNRLLLGSMAKVMGSNKDAGLSSRWARKHIKSIFLKLGPVEF